MNREYKLAADPITTNYGGIRREVIAVVSNHDAIDVLEAIRRAYQYGREDNAAMLEAEGRLLTAPHGGGGKENA